MSEFVVSIRAVETKRHSIPRTAPSGFRRRKSRRNLTKTPDPVLLDTFPEGTLTCPDMPGLPDAATRGSEIPEESVEIPEIEETADEERVYVDPDQALIDEMIDLDQRISEEMRPMTGWERDRLEGLREQILQNRELRSAR